MSSLRSAKPVSADIRSDDPQLVDGSGFDLNWIIDAEPRQLSFAASVLEPVSHRTLNVWTDRPAVQFYSGNSLYGTLYGTSNREYRQSDGLALEPQHYPDSPNHPNFPSTALFPEQTYRTTTVFEIPDR
jgi:aldose 1-epimerase